MDKSVPELKVANLSLISQRLATNEITQEALINSLSLTELNRLFMYLNAREIATRKIAAKLLCQLAHLNSEVQTRLCEHFKFTPMSGKVCLNKIPSNVKGIFRTDPDTLAELRKAEDASYLFWSFPKVDYAEAIGNIDSFPDPLEHLLGFVVTDKTRQVEVVREGVGKEPGVREQASRVSRNINRSARTNSSYSPIQLSRPRFSAKPLPKHISPQPRTVAPKRPTTANQVLNRSANLAPKTLQSIEHSIKRIRDSLTNRPNSQKENSPIRVEIPRGRLHQPSVSPMRQHL